MAEKQLKPGEDEKVDVVAVALPPEVIEITEDMEGQVKAGTRFVQGLYGLPKDKYWEFHNVNEFYWEEGSTLDEQKFLFKDWIWGKGKSYAKIVSGGDPSKAVLESPAQRRAAVSSSVSDEETALSILGIDKDTFAFLKNNAPIVKKLRNTAMIEHHREAILALETENLAL